MANETTITMVGNLTADPELRFLPNGTAMVKFTIASTPRTLDRQSGEWKDGDPLFLTCTGWRDLAEHIAESLTKGTRVIVTGRLKLSRWEDKETKEKRSAYGLDVDEIGPSLRFAQAKVQRMNRSSKNDGFIPDAPQDDAWSIAAPASASAA
ncbi:single-stranded DNA-binding protein [Couchioplanes caeruleus]|uniref:Single-stranded DNA-binding protein n=2 Tax=Couchioplanes caeruleus TaxID=56438 RepID=A0A1K0GNR0_9ACTN|nr:single-stranded DNA-binding protein [Couchioplanes caeruleus]OJF10835.1 single-stranded DNA-binding protein [Couchioplanes caeruleus subsp. caeruleus]ROP32832.1 single-strand DNA-binding protein [Couchioplanes caeruleus]